MKMTSRLALVAAAATLFGAYSANAADLGGGCCADLEERVAELEATTARKGNRVVSLQVYGRVSRAILIWDDGIDDGLNSVDASESGSNFGFVGSASIKPGWTAGYKLEFNARATRQSGIDQFGADNIDDFGIGHSYMWIESEQLGRLTLGKTDSATDGIDDIILANVWQGRGTNEGTFQVRDSNGLSDNGNIGDFVGGFTGQNDDLVRYDSPSIYGFIVSAAWVDLGANGDGDFYDATLRYSGEFNAFRIAAGIGYSVLESDSADDRETLAGSVSIMHVPTGLFAAVGLGEQTNLKADDAGPGSEGDDIGEKDFWHVTAGVEKNYFGYGNTTIYGEYGVYTDYQDEIAFVPGDGNIVGIDGSEAEVFGFGVVQSIDSAAMDVFAQYRLYSFEDNAGGDGTAEEDFSSILVGSRIKF